MGQPKAGILLSSGITLIEQVYLALKDVCREVVLIGHGEGIPESLHSLKRIEDHYKGLGPIGGLEALSSSGLDTEYLVSPCDLFKVNRDVFVFLISQKGMLPIVLKSKNGLEPLVGRYPSSLLPIVRKQVQDKIFALHDLVASAGSTIVPIPNQWELSLSNANSPDDLIF